MMLIKFAFVGGLGSVTNLAVFYVLSNFSIHYMLNSCICFLIAVSQNYFLNALFTFQSKELSLVQYISYVFANIFGYVSIYVCCLFLGILFLMIFILKIYCRRHLVLHPQ